MASAISISFPLDRLAAYVLLRTRFFLKRRPPNHCSIRSGAASSANATRLGILPGLNEKVDTCPSVEASLCSSRNQKRACFLTKQTPTGLLLNKEEFKATFDKVNDSIPEPLHSTVLSFIAASSGWNSAAEELAECEWELVKPLFDGLRREKFNLGQATINFYDEREADFTKHCR